MPDEGEPPVEWIFEVEDGQAEEVLHPPPSGPSNSWLGWLQGASPPRHRGALSRESDTSAATLPGEECLSRDPDALPPEDAEDRGSIFSKMGFPGWFANEPDNPLPPPMPSRMDEHDARSVKRSSQGNVKWSVELDIPDDMLEDEVTHERMARTQSQHTNMPTAENMVSSSALPEDYVRKDTYSDAFLEQFGPSEMAAAVAAATACPDIVPEPEPPLPPPSIPPEEEGFHEVPRGHSPPPASPRDGSHPTTPREPREEKMAAAAPGSPWSPAHISVQNYPMQEKPEEKSEGDKAPWIQDVAVVVDHSESKSDEEPERPTGCCARCKACCCTRRRRKDPEDEKVRQTRSKLLEEEIEDFSGTPMMGCVAWLSHRGLARFPTFCVAFGAIFVMATIGIGMVVRPVEVEVDWDSFLKTDVNTSTMRDVFLFALQHRQTDRRLSAHTELSGHELGRELAEGRELQGNRLYKHNDIYFAYQIPDGVAARGLGFLSSSHLSKVRAFETRLRSGFEWQTLCNMTETLDRTLCQYGVSLVNYVFPSPMIAGPDVVPSQLVYDAGGNEPVAPQVATALMEEHGVKDIIVPSAYESGTPLRTVRTAFRFKWFCCTSLDSTAEQRVVLDRMRILWSDFIDNAVRPAIRDLLEETNRATEQELEVFYTGSTLYSKEVTETLMGDLFLACGSMGFVLVYLILHTQSVLLGVLGMLIIVGAIPMSYVLLAISTGSNKMSIASFLSVFLIVGLGSDVVFVYTDFWSDSKHRKANYGSRLTWTLIHAGKASLATSVTTALSFFANLASVLKPLREFGFFMGLCVVVVWVLLSLIYVPLLLVDEYWCGRCKLPCGRMYKSMTTSGLKVNPKEGRRGAEAYPHVSSFTRFIHKFRRSICLIPALTSIACIVWAVFVVQVDSGVPSIFPEDHNLNKGTKVFATFYDTSQVFNPLMSIGTPQVSVCNDAMFSPLTPTYNPGSWGYNCNLYWCEANPDVDQTEAGVCHCWRKHVDPGCTSSVATVSTKIVAPRKLVAEDVQGPLGDYLANEVGMTITASQRENMQRSSVLAPVVTEEWERGSKEVREVTEVVTELNRGTESSCGWQDMCFCSSWSCKMIGDNWERVDEIVIPTLNSTRRLSAKKALEPEPAAAAASLAASEAPRLLQMLSASELTVAPQNRAAIEIVFGITVTASSLLLGEVDLENGWVFSEMHQVSQPWAQRNMYSFCTNFPKELRVVERRCWMEDFRTYLLDRGDRFPIVSSQFQEQIIPFAQSWLTGMHSTKDYLWIRDGEVKASYYTISADFHSYSDTQSALKYKDLWDEYLHTWNLEASIYTKGAWHTSSLWVRAEAQSALIESTIVTIVIVVALALMGMLIFTRDGKLSSFVVASTMLVIFMLTWFIVVVMAWPIGAIEVIALIVFIGYAVTYSLHIAHRYGSSDVQEDLALGGDAENVRFLRTVFALASIGRAALGSAVTTAGCSIFLVFCTLTIFKKLGGVVLVVTVMSIGVALIPLPAALLLFGPVRPGFCWCLRPLEAYDNVVNARENMVRSLEQRREEQKQRQLERSETQRLKKEEEERRQKEQAEQAEARRAEEEAMRKKDSENKAKQVAIAKAKARALAEAQAKAKAKAKAGPAPGSGMQARSLGAAGGQLSPEARQRARSHEDADQKGQLGTAEARPRAKSTGGEMSPKSPAMQRVERPPGASADTPLKASAMRNDRSAAPTMRLADPGLDVGDEQPLGAHFQGRP